MSGHDLYTSWHSDVDKINARIYALNDRLESIDILMTNMGNHNSCLLESEKYGIRDELYKLKMRLIVLNYEPNMLNMWFSDFCKWLL